MSKSQVTPPGHRETTEFDKNHLINTLSLGATQMGISLSDGVCRRMATYLQYLKAWNQHHNLTAIDSLDKMVTHHLLDCLAILPHVQGDRVCDVGSGAGLPGIPLALARPELHMTLVESRAKKISFLRYAINALKAGNINIEQTRAEEFQPDLLFDTVTVRAVAPIVKLLPLCRPLLAPGGRILAMKSAKVEQELSRLEDHYRAKCTIKELSVPGLDARRCVVIAEY